VTPKYKFSIQKSKFVEKYQNMFTTGQITFGVLFFIAFVIVIAIAYRKDKGLHNQFYKGNYKILLGFLSFIVLLFVIKILFKH
jgi:hypothetical protein